MDQQDFQEFFSRASRGLRPFPYQSRLAQNPWPDAIDAPTGLGKTAAVTLAWVYKRHVLKDEETPRRLIWCLPMRVLAEQTRDAVEQWLENLGLLGQPGEPGRISVHLVIGGSDGAREAQWAEHPESEAILIGTQDMLLSRALMRGYSMSRYQWPVHFAMLHNDALWVFDEAQLMGAGLKTTAQLEAFRRTLEVARPARSLWMSATLNRDWLATVDFRPHLSDLRVLELSEEEQNSPAVRKRRESSKRLQRAVTALTSDKAKSRASGYIAELAEEVLAAHQPGTQTLVIMNTVDRAQSLYARLEKSHPGLALLVHARFREQERSQLNAALRNDDHGEAGRVVIATQAIEAGVDITSRTLFTELAPWSSLVQRFGRCNRYGEWNAEGAELYWIDIEDGLASPYADEELQAARSKVSPLESATPGQLPATDQEAPLHQVLRRRDFIDLFNIDPDLSGFDVDVSPYIRDADDLDAQVFWREQPSADADPPQREELCRASLSQLKRYLDKRRKKHDRFAWEWDSLDGQWKPFQRTARPGLVLMLDAAAGGYDDAMGFAPDNLKKPVNVIESQGGGQNERYGGDWRSRQVRPVILDHHLVHVETEARTLAESVGLKGEEGEAVIRAARWHDVGKAHEVFQQTLTACEEMAGRTDSQWAKSPCRGRHSRAYFRHELASMLGWLSQHGEEPQADLIAYLILAHHGKVRTSLRAMPDEKPPKDPGIRYARGIHEGDRLPAVQVGDESMPETRLQLDLMEMGEGAMGASWADRCHRLLGEFGPFRLAWLESLVRIADWRASNKEQEEQ